MVLKLFNDRILKPKESKPKSDPNRAVIASGSKAPTGAPVRVPPIIIVPSAITSSISTLNVRDFLVDGVYIPPEEKRKEAGAKVDFAQRISHIIFHSSLFSG